MVFALLKSFILPRNRTQQGSKYAALSTHADQNDLERCPSMDSGRCTSGNYSTREKSDLESASQSSSNTRRINPRIIADATIGLSDGLTVPFALTAGLSALGDTKVVIYGGFAELVAGAISMGLGGYLGAKSEAEAYRAALGETKLIVHSDAQRVEGMVREAFAHFGFDEEIVRSMVAALRDEPERMVEFLMRFHRQLAEADFTASRAYVSGLTISAGYFFGGLVPLVPYLIFARIRDAFIGSVTVMALALFAFGWFKTSLVGESNRWVCLKSSVQMVLLGGVAAGAAMGCVKAIA
ncbi:hypothetical protein MBLNU230_g2433t1 [Neophaeotheca triangularis]